MGFTENAAKRALNIKNGELEQAINWLMENIEGLIFFILYFIFNIFLSFFFKDPNLNDPFVTENNLPIQFNLPNLEEKTKMVIGKKKN